MKTNIAVLFGGKSVEHEISIISALQAIENMDKDKFNIIPVYITRKGIMYSGELISNIENYKDIPALLKKSVQVCIIREQEGVFVRPLNKSRLFKQKKIRLDLAFPIVHGLNVEDGTIAGFLHMLDIPYVGCDVLASALGMDKYISKIVLRENNIPVLDCVYMTQHQYFTDEENSLKQIETIPYPIIIKPTDLGSSVGISIARDRNSLLSALETAFTYSNEVIIEPAITNLTEINCSVLGDEIEAEASECEQPLNAGEILSFDNKYLSGGGTKGAKTADDKASTGMASLARRIPADISPEMRTAIRETAVKAFHALGASGIVRIDFMIDNDTGKFYLNEVNTIPGSLAFYLWTPLGLEYKELLTRLIQLALKRSRNEAELIFTFESNVLSQAKSGGAKK